MDRASTRGYCGREGVGREHGDRGKQGRRWSHVSSGSGKRVAGAARSEACNGREVVQSEQQAQNRVGVDGGRKGKYGQ